MSRYTYLAEKLEAGHALSPDESADVIKVLRGGKLSTTEAGNVLLDILQETGMSQNALANAAGVNVGYVSQLTSGSRTLSSNTARRLASALPSRHAMRLHKAAAKDAGFEIDLVTPKRPERS